MYFILLSFKRLFLQLTDLTYWSVMLLAIISNLIDPGSAARAIIILMGVDILTKMYAITAQLVKSHDVGYIKGFFIAIKTRRISSDQFSRRTFAKIFRNFTLMVIAHQAKFIYPQAGDLFETSIYNFIYAVLFAGEAISNIENLMDAGWTDLNPLLSFFKRKQAGMFEAADKGAKQAPDAAKGTGE